MLTRRQILMTCIFLVIGVLVACTDNPNPLPTGATPIPTLIPATLPPTDFVTEAELEPVAASFPAALPSAENGQALYELHCAECHGLDGTGQVSNARDFSDVDYRRGETPLRFFLDTTEGHSGAGAGNDMPAFGEILTSDQRWDVVYYAWRFAAPDESLLAGQEIYAENCVECHGVNGRSKILGAADFSDQRFMSDHPASQLYVSITQGKGSMPAWQARLDQDNRWEVIDYIRTFTYDPVLPIPESEVEADGEEAVAFAPTEIEEPEKPECDASYLEQSNPFAWDDPEAITAGGELYMEYCTRCHGDDGVGTQDLDYIPTDLTNPGVQTLLRENGGEYLCRVADGLNEMPRFIRQMDQEQMWQVLTFMGTLGE